MNVQQEREKQIKLLQQNLLTIRRIAGWTAEQLGDKIGVTKQTISNLENGKTPMNFTQYIAIRSILDYEIETNKENEVLPMVVTILLDKSDKLSEDDYSKIKEAIDTVAATAAGGITGITLTTVYKGIVTPLLGGVAADLIGSIGLLGRGVVAGPAHWLKKIIKKEGGKGLEKI